MVMRKIHLSMITVALCLTTLAGTSAEYRLHSNSSTLVLRSFRTPGSEALQLTGSHLLFKGKPVDEIVSGNKIKRYSIELTGTGFVVGSTVTINSRRAFADDFLNEQEQRITTTYESATDLLIQFVQKHVPPAGLLLIKVVNPDGEESNTLAVDVISPSSELSITSISQDSGPTGTVFSLRGVGLVPPPLGASTPVRFFTAIRFTGVGPEPNPFESFFVR